LAQAVFWVTPSGWCPCRLSFVSPCAGEVFSLASTSAVALMAGAGDGGEETLGATPNFDELGFVVPEGDAISDSARAYARGFEPKARRRLQRFEAQRQKLAAPGQWMEGAKKAALKTLLRKGVPGEHRGEVWWSILGCEARRTKAPRSYQEYVAENLDSKVSESIVRDLTRTYPNHRKFRSPAGRDELHRVLHAFARHAPRICYCQGLNFIAALFLIVLNDEERAFWALACAMESLGVEGYYVDHMALLRADMRVLDEVLALRCPKTSRCLQTQKVDLTSICSEWYLTWFAKCMPVSTTLRVWDALFFEGFKVLFRVSVGIFKRVEAEILGCPGFDQIMEKAKLWPRRQVEHNELLKVSFQSVQPLRRRDLVQARDNALFLVECEDRDRQSRVEANTRACTPNSIRSRSAPTSCSSRQQSPLLADVSSTSSS